MNVTYYYHSGFSVAMGGVLLIFDYWRGEHGELPEDKRITADTLARYDEVYVFVSHEHPDHLDAVVKEWSKLPRVTCIVSGDMPIGTPGKRMNPGTSGDSARTFRLRRLTPPTWAFRSWWTLTGSTCSTRAT